ncbi:hypothetical protein K443DRAFT_11112 [Laccaria amethystina LaAM-08-1]|uniref:Uncharacterized protein n=1 Tax=Laccaria amethystina LaAM-08-1 TaxID=1095629 RepID=A0A0C9XDN9_9AGAR|nr:hypothetical protein K443DRAFT_11112 [Laccaria amethystina LaAM-08-1]
MPVSTLSLECNSQREWNKCQCPPGPSDRCDHHDGGTNTSGTAFEDPDRPNYPKHQSPSTPVSPPTTSLSAPILTETTPLSILPSLLTTPSSYTTQTTSLVPLIPSSPLAACSPSDILVDAELCGTDSVPSETHVDQVFSSLLNDLILTKDSAAQSGGAIPHSNIWNCDFPETTTGDDAHDLTCVNATLKPEEGKYIWNIGKEARREV